MKKHLLKEQVKAFSETHDLDRKEINLLRDELAKKQTYIDELKVEFDVCINRCEAQRIRINTMHDKTVDLEQTLKYSQGITDHLKKKMDDIQVERSKESGNMSRIRAIVHGKGQLYSKFIEIKKIL